MNRRRITSLLFVFLIYSLFSSFTIQPSLCAESQISDCDSLTDWSCVGGSHSLDTEDKQEGSASINAQSDGGRYYLVETYNPSGTWNWSSYNYVMFWIKTNVASRNLGFYLYDNVGRQCRWYGLQKDMSNDVWNEKIITFTSYNYIQNGFNWSAINTILFIQLSNYQTGHEFWVDDVRVGPEGGDDTTPPNYSNLAHNNTIAGQPTKFSCSWSDDVGLSGFIFSTNNTGAWVNSTWTSLSGTSGWSNVTQMLNSMAVVVQYRFYCNDTSNNWHKTTTRSFVVSSSVMSFPFDDNFDDNIMNSTRWVRFEKNNGTVSEANGRVEINVLDPPGAAGYITKTKYDLSYSDIRIDVSNEHLCEATLVITLDGLYDHFWYSNDFYSIEKHRYSNEILVKVRTNGGERIFLYNDTWTGPNGSLRIRIQEGRIYFYEEDNLIYSEAYRLDSYYGYIHFEADTWSNNYYGMDYFDNFSLTYLPPVSSSISIAVSPSIALVGFEVKILGQLTCQQNGTGISNAPLLVSYRYHPDLMSYIPSEKGWNIISTVTTDAHGGYSVTWFVMSSGYYVVEAFYPGFGNVQGASNFTNLLITSLDDKIFSVSSNSTVSAMNFDSTARELNFTVSGPSGTTGYLHMYLAKSLVSDLSELKIYFDGLEQSYEAISVGNTWFIRLTYSHSSHCIRICLGPDMPATTQTSLVLLVLLLTVLATMAIIVLILKYGKINVSNHKQNEHKSCLV